MNWRSAWGACRAIILLGPPGSGKTTVARILANNALLNEFNSNQLRVVDIDDHILEPKWGCTVADALAECGDEAFLQREAETTQDFFRELMEVNPISNDPIIIALTGSNPLNTKTMEFARKLGPRILLDADRDEIIQRMNQMKVNRIVGVDAEIANSPIDISSAQALSRVLDRRSIAYESSYDIRVIIGREDSPNQVAQCAALQLVQDQAFVSTRGRSQAPESDELNFCNVVVNGLAPDRGLYVPRSFPQPFTSSQISRLCDLPYPERALRVMEQFPMGRRSLSPQHLRDMTRAAYSSFTSPENALPLTQLDSHQNAFLMETFHGPTASFKDLALQLVPQFLVHALEAEKSAMNDTIDSNSSSASMRSMGLIVATSGDTGSAALDGFNRHTTFPVIVLYPKHGVSPMQRLQMTTNSSVHSCVVAIDADFDFCQTTVKDLFDDDEFMGDLQRQFGVQFTAANSINWGRLLPQIVFAFSAYADLVKRERLRPGDPMDLTIPTGNFGNVLGAVFAREMGVPIRNIIIASNENNVLTDFIETGVYDLRKRDLHQTLSPSVDILVSSNLERFMFWLSSGDATLVNEMFTRLKRDRFFEIEDSMRQLVQKTLIAVSCNEAMCLQTIRHTFVETGVLIDPHTALAKYAGDRIRKEDKDESVPIVIASTAHYGKFPIAMLRALSCPESNAAVESRNIDSMFEFLKSIHTTNSFKNSVETSLNEMHPSLKDVTRHKIVHTLECERDPNQIRKAIVDFMHRRSQHLSDRSFVQAA